MVIVKSHIACKFVNLLNRQIKSTHFQIFVISLQVDLDFVAPTLEVKRNGRMAGGRAGQLGLGHAGGSNRGEGGSSWHRCFTSSPQTIQTSKNLLQFSKLISCFKNFSKV